MAILAKKWDLRTKPFPTGAAYVKHGAALRPCDACVQLRMAQLWRSYGTAKTLSWLCRSILFYTPPLKKKPKVKITISTAAKPLITILPILVLTMALWSFLIFS